MEKKVGQRTKWMGEAMSWCKHLPLETKNPDEDYICWQVYNVSRNLGLLGCHQSLLWKKKTLELWGTLLGTRCKYMGS
jgi:hypothetical protein